MRKLCPKAVGNLPSALSDDHGLARAGRPATWNHSAGMVAPRATGRAAAMVPTARPVPVWCPSPWPGGVSVERAGGQMGHPVQALDTPHHQTSAAAARPLGHERVAGQRHQVRHPGFPDGHGAAAAGPPDGRDLPPRGPRRRHKRDQRRGGKRRCHRCGPSARSARPQRLRRDRGGRPVIAGRRPGRGEPAGEPARGRAPMRPAWCAVPTHLTTADDTSGWTDATETENWRRRRWPVRRHPPGRPRSGA